MKNLLIGAAAGVLIGSLAGGLAGRATASAGAYSETTHAEPVCQTNGYAGSSVNLDQIFFCTSDGTMHNLYRIR